MVRIFPTRRLFIKINIALFWILLSSTSQLHAQFYNGSQVSFGKNRVQHQKFQWQYFRTEKFDVYYYPTGKELAEYTFFKASIFMEEIERLLNFNPSKKLQFIVYNTQADFRESNFAYDDENFYNQGGVTNIYGTKIYLYFDGNHTHFDKMIRSGIMNIFAHLLVEGETVGRNISAETLFSIPNWYYSGLASFIGENWNSEIDAHVKDGILTQRYVDFDQLPPVDATYAGHSFWKFIYDKYGKNAIPNILHTTRSSRSYERGFAYVTGAPFQQLLTDWYRYYYVIYHKEIKRTLPEGELLVKKPKKKRDYSQINLSPDGESFAYVTNEAGQIKIWLQKAGNKKPKIIFRRYQKTEDNPDLSFPKLAWHPSGDILGFTLEDKGRCYYYPYDINEGKIGKRLLVNVEKISDWSYSPDGKLMLFSGFKNGQSDIFIYSFQARAFQNITNDFFDDYQPRFIDNQNKIIFSSNRNHDTLSESEQYFNATPQPYLDLFLYDYAKKNPQLLRVTNSPFANKTDVVVLNPHDILYLSDENGIKNRYIARFDSTISRIDTVIHYAYNAKSIPITDNAYSIFEQYYNPATNEVADIYLYKGSKKIYRNPLAIAPIEDSLSISVFQQQTKLHKIREDSLAQVHREKPTIKKRHGFFQVYESDLLKKSLLPDTTQIPLNDPILNTDSGIEYTRPIGRNYYVQYTMNKLVTQADFSFLNTSYQQFTGARSPVYLNTGFNALFLVGIQDLFENHRISGGFRFSFDLSSNEFMFSYENLSRRVDHQIVLYRQAIKSLTNEFLLKQRSNSAFYIIKYPFNKLNSVRLTFTGRYESYILGSLDDVSLKSENQNHVWAGVKIEYIFDSSKELFTNLWRGSKIKIFAEYEQRIYKGSKNLFVVGIDARKSVKVFKNMTWVTRFAASTNFGSGRLIYYMGGIDNWMLPKFNNEIPVKQEIDYAYQTLATNMRGFEQNIRNGTSFALVNTELRVPFVQLLSKRKIGNYFLNSLQLILFGDIGTAWTGLHPYSEENSLYTRVIETGSITAIVKRNIDPIVAGFGLGLRASLLGYFLRFDYAWGLEDWRIYDKKGIFTFSIGLDL